MWRWTLVVPCLVAASCSGATPDPRFPTLDLPRVGTIGWHAGDLPPPVVVVNLHRDGRLTMSGEEVPLDRLGERLVPVARAAPGKDDAMGAEGCRAGLVIRGDRDVPWRAVQWVLQTAASPEVRMGRVFYGVLPEVGGEEGTLAMFLPCDQAPWRPAASSGRTMRVQLVTDEGRDTRPTDLSPLVARAGKVAEAMIDAGGRVPLGTVLATADVLLRSGVTSITFRGARGPAPGEGRPVAASVPSTVSILLDGVPVPAAPPEAPLSRSVRVAGIAGSTGPFLVVVDPAIEEAMIEPDERVIEDPPRSSK